MEYKEFKRHLAKAELTIGEFASLLGIRANSISNHKKSNIVPPTYAMLVILAGRLRDEGMDVKQLLRSNGFIVRSDIGKSDSNVHQLDLFRIKKSTGNLA